LKEKLYNCIKKLSILKIAFEFLSVVVSFVVILFANDYSLDSIDLTHYVNLAGITFITNYWNGRTKIQNPRFASKFSERQ